MEIPQNITPTHASLLTHFQSLFDRGSIATNTYLFKNMKAGLEIPIYIIIEQKKISQITKDQSTILQALKMCDKIIVDPTGKFIKIIDFPTVKLQSKLAKKLKEIEEALLTKEYKYSVNYVYQGNGDRLITLYKENGWEILQQCMAAGGKTPYVRSSLFEQMKQGVAKFKKTKRQQHFHSGYNNSTRFNPEKPLPIFIRKAVQTDQQQQSTTNKLSKLSIQPQEKVTKKQQSPNRTNNKGKHNNGANNSTSEKEKKKYKQVKHEPIIMNDDDFPSLS